MRKEPRTWKACPMLCARAGGRGPGCPRCTCWLLVETLVEAMGQISSLERGLLLDRDICGRGDMLVLIQRNMLAKVLEKLPGGEPSSSPSCSHKLVNRKTISSHNLCTSAPPSPRGAAQRGPLKLCDTFN